MFQGTGAILAFTAAMVFSGCGDSSTVSNLKSNTDAITGNVQLPEDHAPGTKRDLQVIKLTIGCHRVVGNIPDPIDTIIEKRRTGAHYIDFRVRNYYSACGSDFTALVSYDVDGMVLDVKQGVMEKCRCNFDFDPFRVQFAGGASWTDMEFFDVRLAQNGSPYPLKPRPMGELPDF